MVAPDGRKPRDWDGYSEPRKVRLPAFPLLPTTASHLSTGVGCHCVQSQFALPQRQGGLAEKVFIPSHTTGIHVFMVALHDSFYQ